PEGSLGLPFCPMGTSKGYLEWPLLAELFPLSFPGVQSKQDSLVIDIDRDRLERRIRDYFDPSIADKEMAERYPGSMDGSNACEPIPTRAKLVKRGFLEKFLVP